MQRIAIKFEISQLLNQNSLFRRYIYIYAEQKKKKSCVTIREPIDLKLTICSSQEIEELNRTLNQSVVQLEELEAEKTKVRRRTDDPDELAEKLKAIMEAEEALQRQKQEIQVSFQILQTIKKIPIVNILKQKKKIIIKACYMCLTGELFKTVKNPQLGQDFLIIYQLNHYQ